jgi:hypothetical protein
MPPPSARAPPRRSVLTSLNADKPNITNRGERMDEQQRRARELDALEAIAMELERLRVLNEHELGVRLEHPPEGDTPYAVRVEE